MIDTSSEYRGIYLRTHIASQCLSMGEEGKEWREVDWRKGRSEYRTEAAMRLPHFAFWPIVRIYCDGEQVNDSHPHFIAFERRENELGIFKIERTKRRSQYSTENSRFVLRDYVGLEGRG